MKNWKTLLCNVPRNKNQTDSDLAPACVARAWLRPKATRGTVDASEILRENQLISS